jgi:hypothetical protein
LTLAYAAEKNSPPAGGSGDLSQAPSPVRLSHVPSPARYGVSVQGPPLACTLPYRPSPRVPSNHPLQPPLLSITYAGLWPAVGYRRQPLSNTRGFSRPHLLLFTRAHRGFVTPSTHIRLYRVSRPLPSQAPIQSLPATFRYPTFLLFLGHGVDYPTPFRFRPSSLRHEGVMGTQGLRALPHSPSMLSHSHLHRRHSPHLEGLGSRAGCGPESRKGSERDR